MSNSTIDVYKSCKILREKNFILDAEGGVNAMSTYLGTLTKKTFTKAQYIKHRLSITLDLDWKQAEFQMNQSAYDWNYIRIRNGADPFFYYFVERIDWLSENTARFVLLMDTINTFKYNVKYIVDKKTLVNRMHKDRYEKMSSTQKCRFVIPYDSGTEVHEVTNSIIGNLKTTLVSYSVVTNESCTGATISSISYTGTLHVVSDPRRLQVTCSASSSGSITFDVTLNITDSFSTLIDFKSEGITAPLYKYKEEKLIDDRGNDEVQWRLYYKNATGYAPDNPTPVECYLYPDRPITIKYLGSQGIVGYADLVEDEKYLFLLNYDYNVDWNNFSVSMNDIDVPLYYDEVGRPINNPRLNAIYITKATGESLISLYVADNNNAWSLVGKAAQIKFNTYSQNLYIKMHKYNAGQPVLALSQILEYGYFRPSYATYEFSLASSWLDGSVSNYIDRTLEENIKIIDPPYLPTPHRMVNGAYRIGSPWMYDNISHTIKLTDFESLLSSEVETQSIEEPNAYLYLDTTGLDLTGTGNRWNVGDPKLKHSEFARPKFVYDSFSKDFYLEMMNINYDAPYFFSFKFNMTKNIASKFLFSFIHIKNKVSVENYDNIMIAIRNNEEVLYSSQYLNYLRTGYNFDVKSKERQETAGAIGLGLSAGGVMASLLLSSNPVGALAVATAGIGLANQYVSYAKMQAENESSIERKLQESKLQATNVLNADDLDLLKEYSGNKAKLCLYRVSDRMLKVLDDLFYYAGYSVNEQMIPTTDSRYWFNFVQCDLVVSETDNISDECMNDIIERFKQGVTFLHYRNSTFDFAQEKENLEVGLVTPPTP